MGCSSYRGRTTTHMKGTTETYESFWLKRYDKFKKAWLQPALKSKKKHVRILKCQPFF